MEVKNNSSNLLPLDVHIDKTSTDNAKRKTDCTEDNNVIFKKKKEDILEDGELIEDNKPTKDVKLNKNQRKFEQFNRKRKVALLLAYCGANYHGMQKNPDVETIELKLMEALCKINSITPEHKRSFLESNDNQISFQRAARTDKGVSAARQVVSLKIIAEESFIEDVNKELPVDIRVFGLERVTKTFDAKCSCSGRTYEYLIPSFAFAPSREIYDASYRIPDEQFQVVSDIFSKYVGTHNFHNFTSGKHFNEKSAMRYITSFEPSKPFIRDGYEFISIEINGQSFMIHQIRKMIGLCIAISRKYCCIETLDKAFAEPKLDIPKAPGLGLLLNNVYFKQYNKKFGRDGLHNPLTYDQEQKAIEKFKKEFIWKNIIAEEIKTLSMTTWLKTLSNHTYKEIGMSNVIGGNYNGEKGSFPPNQITFKKNTTGEISSELKKDKAELNDS